MAVELSAGKGDRSSFDFYSHNLYQKQRNTIYYLFPTSHSDAAKVG
ncbi:MAG: hypothetical protein AAFQ14_09885 [Cyanobacteria bacterium J06621_12]